MIYKDRRDAGEKLDDKLSHYRDKADVVVLEIMKRMGES
jgi:predicted phosphoribosyltransferase